MNALVFGEHKVSGSPEAIHELHIKLSRLVALESLLSGTSGYPSVLLMWETLGKKGLL